MLYVNPLAGGMNPASALPDSPQRRHEVLQQFEQLLLNQMLKEMRKSVPQGGLFEKSPAMQYYEEMQDDFFAAQLAKSGQLGITKIMEQQLAGLEQPLETQAFSGGLPLHPAQDALPLNRKTQEAPSLESFRKHSGLPINTPAALGLPLRRMES